MELSLFFEIETADISDTGVDEMFLFMQLYTTPHDTIMRSIETLATEVMPKLK
jgi:hypothetical protein